MPRGRIREANLSITYHLHRNGARGRRQRIAYGAEFAAPAAGDHISVMTLEWERSDSPDDLGLGTDRWLSVREAARRASVDPRTIRRWADTGRIRARRTPGGHRQISLSGLGNAYSATSRKPPPALDLDPPTAVPQWAAQATVWHSWHPPQRLTEDDLMDLRLDIDACHRALDDIKEIITVELRRRDNEASSQDDFWRSPS